MSLGELSPPWPQEQENTFMYVIIGARRKASTVGAKSEEPPSEGLYSTSPPILKHQSYHPECAHQIADDCVISSVVTIARAPPFLEGEGRSDARSDLSSSDEIDARLESSTRSVSIIASEAASDDRHRREPGERCCESREAALWSLSRETETKF